MFFVKVLKSFYICYLAFICFNILIAVQFCKDRNKSQSNGASSVTCLLSTLVTSVRFVNF